MSLKDDGGGVFQTVGSGLSYEDISCLVLNDGQTALFGEGGKKVAELPFMFGFVGNGGQSGEPFKIFLVGGRCVDHDGLL